MHNDSFLNQQKEYAEGHDKWSGTSREFKREF